ncbi:hypothetical protein [Streptomyces sp. NPDC047061]|uniref:hypothetical protein n=1 Tax=Streptomyces sp. NPDC047061 TaxID=3154605 RepID=UPI0033F722D6
MAGRAVQLIPDRSETPDEVALSADGPVQGRVVGEALGRQVGKPDGEAFTVTP